MRSLGIGARSAARRAWLWQHRRKFGLASPGPRRLLVDISAIIQHDAQTGIQRVVRAVWSELSTRAELDFELVPIFATDSRGYCYAPADFLNSKPTKHHRDPVGARAGDKFLGLDLAAHVLPKYRAQLRAWRRHGATVHLVIYDLLPLLQPDWFNRKATSNFREWVAVLAADADQALCISRQVSRDLREYLRDNAPSSTLAIANLQLGGDISKSRPTTGVSRDVSALLDRLRFRPAILMVGTIEPRKAYDKALAAFDHLWATRCAQAPDLVIVGKPGWKTRALQKRIRQHPEHGKRLYWFDDVTDEGLCLLYEASRGLCMASYAEGFGLPLVEAMMHHRHVLARDLPVFREQNLPNVSFFEDDRPEVLADHIMDLMGAGPLSSHYATRLPTWAECGDGLLGELGMGRSTEEQAGSSAENGPSRSGAEGSDPEERVSA